MTTNLEENPEAPADPFSTVELHPDDNIVVTKRGLSAGTALVVRDREMAIAQDVPMGHKIAVRRIHRGEKVVKFGAPIGSAARRIEAGEHVHLHNLRSDYIPAHDRSATGGAKGAES